MQTQTREESSDRRGQAGSGKGVSQGREDSARRLRGAGPIRVLMGGCGGWQQQGDGDVRAGGRCWMDLVDGEWFEGEGLAQNLTTQQRARGMTANSTCSLPGT
jgi:hypothetical protein